MLDSVEDICGICGEPGANKVVKWDGGGLYWPGEFRPDSEVVHAECENEEQLRAFSALSKEERAAFLRGI